MNTHKAITAVVLVLTALLLNTPAALAAVTREFVGTIENKEAPHGIAVDQETGNVYITHPETEGAGFADITGFVDITGPEGGPPVGGVPSKIENIPYAGPYKNQNTLQIGIAVDNSCYEHQPRLTGKACEEYDPAYGDVYTFAPSGGGANAYIAKYHLNEQHMYELVGKIALSVFTEGITVDSRGNIYYGSGRSLPERVIELKKVLEHLVVGGHEETLESLEEVVILEKLIKHPGFFAVDNAGNMYVSDAYEYGSSREGYLGAIKLQLDGAGGVLSEEVFAPNTRQGGRQPLAVDRTTGNILVGEPPSTTEVYAPSVGEFNAAGEQQLVFGSESPFDGSFGTGGEGPGAIAVDEATNYVYVVNYKGDDVDVFGPAAGPPVVEGQQPAVAGVTRTSALIGGVANPEGEHSQYFFEYVEGREFAPEASNPYGAGRHTAVTELPGGHVARAVERVPLTGLLPGRTYHYRMVVSSPSGVAYGPDETFATLPATPPLVQTGVAVGVSATGVTLTGAIDPQGLQTSYVFEVGGDTSYGGARLFGGAGDGTTEVAVSAELRYLAPGATYHYRLAATSFDGTSYGQDGTFTTPPVSGVVAQPGSEPLIASPLVSFPSVAGAVAGPVGKAKAQRTRHAARKQLARALRVCAQEKRRERRSVCRSRARRQYKRAA